MPTNIATVTELPRAAPMRKASFTSPMPIPAGYARAAARRKPEAAKAPIAQRGLGWSAVLAESTMTPAGTTLGFGMSRCSRSVAETATSVREKKAATAAEPLRPNFQKHAAKRRPVTRSTAGSRTAPSTPHDRQRQRRTAYERIGTLSYQEISGPQ